MQGYNKAAPEEKSKERLANSVEADNEPFLKHIRGRESARRDAEASRKSQCKAAQGMKKSLFCNDSHRRCFKEEIGARP